MLLGLQELLLLALGRGATSQPLNLPLIPTCRFNSGTYSEDSWGSLGELRQYLLNYNNINLLAYRKTCFLY